VNDPVNHPKHYTSHPSGVECIQVTEHFNFCIGNAIKYLWRAGEKGEYVQDLQKAKWYIDRELTRFEKSLPSVEEVQNIYARGIQAEEKRLEEQTKGTNEKEN
jgi:Protein of unknwon function (DUF3310)